MINMYHLKCNTIASHYQGSPSWKPSSAVPYRETKVRDSTISYISIERQYHGHKQNQGDKINKMEAAERTGSQSDLMDLMAVGYTHIPSFRIPGT